VTRRRLFVAVEIPDAAQDAVDAAIDPWRDALRAARWVPRANRHVTVRFVGWTAPELVGAVTDAVRATAAATPRFDLAVTAAGRFPPRGKARVLWIGLDDPAGALAVTAGRLQTRMADALPPEARAFTPHLTVARARPPIRVPDGWAAADVEPSRWTVEHLVLFESHLGRPHARYEPLERCALVNVADPRPDPG